MVSFLLFLEKSRQKIVILQLCGDDIPSPCFANMGASTSAQKVQNNNLKKAI